MYSVSPFFFFYEGRHATAGKKWRGVWIFSPLRLLFLLLSCGTPTESALFVLCCHWLSVLLWCASLYPPRSYSPLCTSAVQAYSHTNLCVCVCVVNKASRKHTHTMWPVNNKRILHQLLTLCFFQMIHISPTVLNWIITKNEPSKLFQSLHHNHGLKYLQILSADALLCTLRLAR